MSLEGVRRFTRPLLFLSGVVVTTRLLVVIEGKLLANAFGKDGPIGRRPEILLRVDGIKKLTSSLTVAVAIGISLRGIGVDVASLLTVGGISGLAIGLAGRQVLENVFAAFAIYLTAPFSPGEDIVFSSGSLAGVEGTVVDIGIFRTALRNYDRDLWTVPNSAFTSATVLNITRRPNEYQIYESVPLRPTDIASLEQAIFTFRKELKSDERVVPYLIQRVYLNKVASDGLHVVLRMYVFAANRTQFYNIRQVRLYVPLFLSSKIPFRHHRAQSRLAGHFVQLHPHLREPRRQTCYAFLGLLHPRRLTPSPSSLSSLTLSLCLSCLSLSLS